MTILNPEKVILRGKPDIDDSAIVGYPPARTNLKFGDRLLMGVGATIRAGTVIYLGSRIGANFETGHGVVVREENFVGDGVKIWNGTTMDYGCVIGDGVKIHCNCYVAQKTTIDANAFLAPGVTVANVKYPTGDSAKNHFEPVTICRGAVVGANATLLPGITIGTDALVGAGAVVTRDVPPNWTVYGNPARHRDDQARGA